MNKDDLRRLPPFTRTLAAHMQEEPLYFATPGHHGGAFFRLLPAGKAFVKLLGESVFRADMSDSDDVLGDVSSHEGPGGEAERLAAEVYHADRTYFVLNGTSASNRICCAALLAPGDLVLFDRNNHKSLYQAMMQCGVQPVYLEGARNEAGVIGGLRREAFDEAALRRLAESAAPEAGRKARPFRLACLQLATYDGIFCDAAALIETLGRLCDYILFDSAWAGYESFIRWMDRQSPLTQPLSSEAPGILVTQSVHKQLAGFSQTSQIQRKDSHLQGLARRVDDDVFQSTFSMHISTSPCFPLFAGLEMNAALHQESGEALWEEAMRFAADLRKEVLWKCRYVRPFQRPQVSGKRWEDWDTETIIRDRRFYEICPEESWHGFSGIREGQYLLDPCKVLLLTGKIPAAVLGAYLQARHIIPEKSDLHTLLFLAEPGDGAEKKDRLVEAVCRFEAAYEAGTLLSEMLPELAARYPRGMTLRALCEAQSGFFEARGAAALQQRLFRREFFPREAMGGRQAQEAFVRGWKKRVRLDALPGHIALEPAAAYPPGICSVAAGEVWNDTAAAWFGLLADYAGRFPGFGTEMNGIHLESGKDGRVEGWGWVWDGPSDRLTP